MKKVLTLIAAVLMTIGADAGNVKVGLQNLDSSTTNANTVIADNECFTATTVFEATSNTSNKYKYAHDGLEFTGWIQLRVTNDPTKDSPTGDSYSKCTSVVIKAKQNATFTAYLRTGDKTVNLFDQETATALPSASAKTADSSSSGNYFWSWTWTIEAGKTYTLTERGGTGQLSGFSYEIVELGNSASFNLLGFAAGNPVEIASTDNDEVSLKIGRTDGTSNVTPDETRGFKVEKSRYFTITVPEGTFATKIEFTSNSNGNTNNGSVGILSITGESENWNLGGKAVGYTWTNETNFLSSITFENVGDGNFYCSAVKVYYAELPEVTAPQITISASSTSVTSGEPVTLTAEIEGVPTPTIQWYSNVTNSAEGGEEIVGATNKTYIFAPTVGTKYYYALASNSVKENVPSNVVAVTAIANTECLVNKVVYSNTFDAFIVDPKKEDETTKNGTITAYYLDSEGAPTITDVKVSTGASYEVEGNTLVVTAEDGETTSVYDITLEAVKPNIQSEVTFDGTETWIKTGYSYDSEKGWKFSKNVDEDSNKRITEGKNRIYFFVGHAKSVTLTNGLVNSDRAVKVYVNGVEDTSIKSIPKSSASTNSVTITCNPEVDNMIAIVSNQTSGDGGFTSASISITAVPVSVGATGYATFASDYALDFTGVEDVTAYYATDADNDKVTMTKVTGTVAAGEGLFLQGKGEVSIPVVAEGEELDNLLVRGEGKPVEKEEGYNKYVLGADGESVAFFLINNTAATVAKDKAYLKVEAKDGARLAIVFDGETTGINEAVVNGAQQAVGTYNLNGQRVAQPTKGLYIVNGKKVIIK